MRIKMLKTSANPKRTMDAGKVYTVDDKLARDLVKAKAAEYVEQPMEMAVKEPEPEAAVIDEPKPKQNYNVSELRKMLKERGLPTSGNKAELSKRLAGD